MPTSVQRSYRETIVHYEGLRRVVHEFTEDEFKDYSVTLRDIQYHDALEADKWSNRWLDREKAPIWDWERMYHDYHSHSGVKRFDIALSAGGVLSALCYGIPSRRKLTLKLHAISRRPYDNPLQGKILTIILFAADAYARLLGCEELWICNPMNEKLVDVYQRYGYRANKNRMGNTTHLAMRLKYD